MTNAITPTNPREVYVTARLQGDAPAIARRHADHAYSIRDDRYLDELLDGAEEEFEAELARRQEEAATPPPPEPEPVSLDARKANLRQEIEALTKRCGRLAPRALTDEGACLEMSNVEAEIEAKNVEIRRIGEAQKNAEEMAPIEAAEREQKEKALAAAEKQAARLPAAAKAVDVAAVAFAKAVMEHRTIGRRERELREEAGTMRPEPFGLAARNESYELALRFALGKHDVGDTVERAHSAVGHQPPRPLSEPDAVNDNPTSKEKT